MSKNTANAETPSTSDMEASSRHHPIHYDAARRRLWILGQRCHHGATGAVMAAGAATWLAATRISLRAGVTLLTTAGVLMAHDWHDRSHWFERGWQDEH